MSGLQFLCDDVADLEKMSMNLLNDSLSKVVLSEVFRSPQCDVR